MQPEDKRIILITGAGSGIGRALTQKIAGEHTHVVLVGRQETSLKETAKTLPKTAAYTIITADITSHTDIENLVKTLTEKLGFLDILINNAGIAHTCLLENSDAQIISDVINTNLTAPILLTRALLPLLKQSYAAQIVNIGSMFGDIGFPFFAAYSASKFGLRGFSDALRRELKDDNISITYAAPRAVKTPATDKYAYLIPAYKMKLDTTEQVATQIWQAIINKKRSIYPKGAERLIILLQRLYPKLIDKALKKQTTTARNS